MTLLCPLARALHTNVNALLAFEQRLMREQLWTIFGQIVLIILIQIGGMGFMTIISLAALATGRKIGLKERSVLSESVNKPELGGIIRMVKKIATGTFICEGIGALLLSTRFIPKMGLLQGIGNSAFLAISAFCNAGFDLNGKYGAYSSDNPPD